MRIGSAGSRRAELEVSGFLRSGAQQQQPAGDDHKTIAVVANAPAICRQPSSTKVFNLGAAADGDASSRFHDTHARIGEELALFDQIVGLKIDQDGDVGDHDTLLAARRSNSAPALSTIILVAREPKILSSSLDAGSPASARSPTAVKAENKIRLGAPIKLLRCKILLLSDATFR